MSLTISCICKQTVPVIQGEVPWIHLKHSTHEAKLLSKEMLEIVSLISVFSIGKGFLVTQVIGCLLNPLPTLDYHYLP